MNVEDRLRKKRGDAELRELLVRLTLRGGGDGVEDYALLHTGVSDPIVSRSTEKSVAREREDPARSLIVEDVCGLAEGASSVDHVVDDDAVAAGNVSDEVHGVDGSGAGALLDDHSEADVAEVELGAEALWGGGRS